MGIDVLAISTPAPRSEEERVDRWVLLLGDQGSLGVASVGGVATLSRPGVGAGKATFHPLVVHAEGQLGSVFLNTPRAASSGMDGSVEGILEDTGLVLLEDNVAVEDSVL